MKPLIVVGHHFEPTLGVRAGQTARIAVQSINIDSTANILVIRAPAFTALTLLIGAGRYHNASVSSGVLKLLHVDHKGIGWAVGGLLQLVLYLDQYNVAAVGDLISRQYRVNLRNPWQPRLVIGLVGRPDLAKATV